MRRIITDLEEWHTGTSDFYDSKLLYPERGFRAECAVYQNGSLILTRSRFPSVRFVHDPMSMSHVNNEYLLVQKYHSGSERGVLGDTATFVDGGKIHIIDMSRFYASVSKHAVVDAVIIPYGAVDYVRGRDPAYVSMSCDDGKGRLLELALSSLMAEAESPSGDATDLNSAFCMLVRTLMLQHRDLGPPEVRNVDRKTLIQRFIDNNLSNPELSISRICESFHLSRSSLYRLFDNQGGIARYISDQRLHRCLADLASAPPVRGQVRIAAERWGFFEAGNFNRSFRERFGVRPSDCIGVGVPGMVDLNGDMTPLQSWMRRPGTIAEGELGRYDNKEWDVAI